AHLVVLPETQPVRPAAAQRRLHGNSRRVSVKYTRIFACAFTSFSPRQRKGVGCGCANLWSRTLALYHGAVRTIRSAYTSRTGVVQTTIKVRGGESSNVD